jgi:anthranilate synthase component 1
VSEGRSNGVAHPLMVQRVATRASALRQLAYRDPARFPVLLDSSAPGALGRYSILAAYPQGAVWLDTAGELHWGGSGSSQSDRRTAPKDGSPSGFLAALESAWQSEAGRLQQVAGNGAAGGLQMRAGDHGPFHGGWMVFLGYELVREIEPKLALPTLGCDIGAPAAFALRVPVALVFDHGNDEGWIVAEPGYEVLGLALSAALDLLPALPPPPDEIRVALSSPLWEEPAGLFRERVERALGYIRAGDIYQANLSRPWRARLDLQPHRSGSSAHGDPAAALYERLRSSNPAPFAAFASFGDWRLLCSSPERLVAVADGSVQTRPIAGTRPRSRERGADPRETAALIAHPKERAEHVMLIDLERNDLGRICEPGSVRVDELMATESYAHVHHIVSNVRGRLRTGLTPIDVLRAIFPGGTITGCPKFRCMQIIAELEGAARGAYTGALGFINHDGSMDFNILIRSLTLIGSQLEFRAGAGIVADSDWRRELEETRAKARGLLAALQKATPVPDLSPHLAAAPP